MSPNPDWLLPARTAFTVAVPLRVTDMNTGNHLGNDTLVSLLHEARVRYLAHMGASERDAGDGTGLIQRDLQVRYLRQIRYGDAVEIDLVPDGVRKASFAVLYRVRAGGATAAEARTGMGGFDYTRQRPVALPESLRLRLEADAAALEADAAAGD